MLIYWVGAFALITTAVVGQLIARVLRQARYEEITEYRRKAVNGLVFDDLWKPCVHHETYQNNLRMLLDYKHQTNEYQELLRKDIKSSEYAGWSKPGLVK